MVCFLPLTPLSVQQNKLTSLVNMYIFVVQHIEFVYIIFI